MVRGVEERSELASLLDRIDVLVTGTGLGQDRWSHDMLAACLECGSPLVLDADGLNLLAGEGERYAGRQRDWILTPHPAEAGRLLDCAASEVQADRVGSALRLAERYGAVVVLKGCGTVVADASGRYAICPYGNPGMASAGTGDVLSGVIGAMLAQGLDCWEAATAGVLAHALAGDLAAATVGERGLLASDITDCLPAVLNPVP
jgi:NAD(P)H-hydrate epimerase